MTPLTQKNENIEQSFGVTAVSMEKNQNLTKSYDNGHAHIFVAISEEKNQNLMKSYDNGRAHNYSWPFKWIKFRIKLIKPFKLSKFFPFSARNILNVFKLFEHIKLIKLSKLSKQHFKI